MVLRLMAFVEIFIWASKKKKGTPIKIDGINFRPLLRAEGLVDDIKTEELKRELARQWGRLP